MTPWPAQRRSRHRGTDLRELRQYFSQQVIFRNALDIAEIVRQLLEEGWGIDPEDLARISP
ncbi:MULTISPECIES: hypothetical protein [Streptomyces]|uniref:Transposase n=1 Tax=Streptomyces yunnanensis TaxID=156453 RepID=A0ABY8A4D3_9ACTN|nr:MULTISPECIES: hypothetical protein [Streptomyces]AJC54275.1 hypothetical protein GZL_01679 [Streptomyces sp. 769]WEB39074.1 transposase [Streptomyces yunnanensis]